MEVVNQLVREDVTEPRELHGLCSEDIEGASTWSPEIRGFLSRICSQARMCTLH